MSAPGFRESTGHFTQLVWASSTRIGAARSTSWDGTALQTYIVVEYSPPGNLPGRYSRNVPRARP